jgi:nuclear pore complex protein Nup188
LCSNEQELYHLVINDLYYHIHGELEGRRITSGSFEELLSFLLEFKVFEHNPLKKLQTPQPAASYNLLFDVQHIRDELGVEYWNHSDWKTSKEVAEKMLHIMHKANLIKYFADAKLSTLRSMLTFLSVYNGAVRSCT